MENPVYYVQHARQRPDRRHRRRPNRRGPYRGPYVGRGPPGHREWSCSAASKNGPKWSPTAADQGPRPRLIPGVRRLAGCFHGFSRTSPALRTLARPWPSVIVVVEAGSAWPSGCLCPGVHAMEQGRLHEPTEDLAGSAQGAQCRRFLAHGTSRSIRRGRLRSRCHVRGDPRRGRPRSSMTSHLRNRAGKRWRCGEKGTKAFLWGHGQAGLRRGTCLASPGSTSRWPPVSPPMGVFTETTSPSPSWPRAGRIVIDSFDEIDGIERLLAEHP